MWLLQELCPRLKGQYLNEHINYVNIMQTGLCHIHVRGLTAKLIHLDWYLIAPLIFYMCLYKPSYPTSVSALIKASSYSRH